MISVTGAGWGWSIALGWFTVRVGGTGCSMGCPGEEGIDVDLKVELRGRSGCSSEFTLVASFGGRA